MITLTPGGNCMPAVHRPSFSGRGGLAKQTVTLCCQANAETISLTPEPFIFTIKINYRVNFFHVISCIYVIILHGDT